MRLREIFRRGQSLPSSPGSASPPTKKSNRLHEDDILLSIVAYLDIDSLFNLRLANRTINQIIKDNESWVCNNVAKNAYDWVFDASDTAFRDRINPPPHLSRFPTFKSLIRLHLATLLPILLLWNQYKNPMDQDTTLILPGERVTAACARGFLTLWAMSDMEREIEQGSTTKFPREEYFAFSKIGGPYIHPHASRAREENVEQRQPKADGRARVQFMQRLVMTYQRYFVHTPSARSRQRRQTNSEEGPPMTQAILDADVPELLRRFQRARRERLDLVAQLDQGAWLDLHLVTTLVLAFYVSYPDSASRRNGQQFPDKLIFSEWALRQGPDLVLGVLSTDPKRRAWIHQWIDGHWFSRPDELKDQESSWTNTGPLGISTRNMGRYPHPKCDEWEAEGWPTLVSSLKELLFKDWKTYMLKSDKSVQALAAALAERTGNINFQKRMQ